jgi:hypothetical protein
MRGDIVADPEKKKQKYYPNHDATKTSTAEAVASWYWRWRTNGTGASANQDPSVMLTTLNFMSFFDRSMDAVKKIV